MYVGIITMVSSLMSLMLLMNMSTFTTVAPPANMTNVNYIASLTAAMSINMWVVFTFIAVKYNNVKRHADDVT